MNPKQLRQLLESAGLSQSEAARVIGITDRTLRRYIAGDMPTPRAIEFALLYVIGQKKRADDVGATIRATGKTVTFTTTVSRRRRGDGQFMLTWRDGKRYLFQTTVSDTGARAHRHLYGKLTALLEDLT